MDYLSDNLVIEAHQYVEVIDLEKACEMLKQGINIIDVREPEEYSKGAIPGAINMPRSVLEFVVNDHLNERDRQKPHIIYCRSGGRAALAAVTMKNMGYIKVHAMHGGFDHWEEEGRRVENNPTQD
jgi:rhodanese-related sulfurtransferase